MRGSAELYMTGSSFCIMRWESAGLRQADTSPHVLEHTTNAFIPCGAFKDSRLPTAHCSSCVGGSASVEGWLIEAPIKDYDSS